MFWCELQNFRDIGLKDVCNLSNMVNIDGSVWNTVKYSSISFLVSTVKRMCFWFLGWAVPLNCLHVFSTKVVKEYSLCAEQPPDARSVSIRGNHLPPSAVLQTEKQTFTSCSQDHLPRHHTASSGHGHRQLRQILHQLLLLQVRTWGRVRVSEKR